MANRQTENFSRRSPHDFNHIVVVAIGHLVVVVGPGGAL